MQPIAVFKDIISVGVKQWAIKYLRDFHTKKLSISTNGLSPQCV